MRTIGVLVWVVMLAQVSAAAPLREHQGFSDNAMDPSDDGSQGPVPLGFKLTFAGQSFSTLFVSNNGYVVFGRPAGAQFTSTIFRQPLLAAFFADVDTRGPNSAITRWGTDVIDGKRAFGVNWPGVGYFQYHSDKLNDFQLVIIERADVRAGAFDLELNYQTINWDCGDSECEVPGRPGRSALVGYSDGVTDTLQQGSDVAGALLDSNLVTGLRHRSRGSAIPGRYVFEFRGELADGGRGDGGEDPAPDGGEDPVAPWPGCAGCGPASAAPHPSPTIPLLALAAFLLARRRWPSPGAQRVGAGFCSVRR